MHFANLSFKLLPIANAKRTKMAKDSCSFAPCDSQPILGNYLEKFHSKCKHGNRIEQTIHLTIRIDWCPSLKCICRSFHWMCSSCIAPIFPIWTMQIIYDAFSAFIWIANRTQNQRHKYISIAVNFHSKNWRTMQSHVLCTDTHWLYYIRLRKCTR